MDYQPPPFFSRGPAPLVRLGFFACLAVLLMVLDARFRYAESLRQVVALLAYPLQRVALAPGDLFGSAAGFFTTQVSLKQENEQLKAKQLLAANELLTVDALRAENAQLRRLLEARERLPRPSTLAEILCFATARTDQNRRVNVISQELNVPPTPTETEPATGKLPKQKRAITRERGRGKASVFLRTAAAHPVTR